MAKAPSSRNKLITAAHKIIVQRGFKGMTVDAVCEAAQVTKGGFFYHFKTKEDLGVAVLDQFWSDAMSRQESSRYHLATDPIEKLLIYIDHTIEAYQDPAIRNGCLLAIYTIESNDTHPAIFAGCVDRFKEWKANIQSMLENAARMYPPKGSFDVEAWADLYIATLEGAIILSKSMDNPAAITRSLNLYRGQLLSQLPSYQPQTTKNKTVLSN